MAIGIDPTVDYAFKLLLGNPEHPAIAIHFLNAVLGSEIQITDVQFLDPILGKEHDLDKLSILDIVASDSTLADDTTSRCRPVCLRVCRSEWLTTPRRCMLAR